ncbi:hypothetical protein U1Q18_036424 [Sarracenia purpurea var. burkii]
MDFVLSIFVNQGLFSHGLRPGFGILDSCSFHFMEVVYGFQLGRQLAIENWDPVGLVVLMTNGLGPVAFEEISLEAANARLDLLNLAKTPSVDRKIARDAFNSAKSIKEEIDRAKVLTFDSARLASLAKRIRFLKGQSPIKPISDLMRAAIPVALIDKETDDEDEVTDSEGSEGVEAEDVDKDAVKEAELGEVETEHDQGNSSTRPDRCGVVDLKKEPGSAIKDVQFDEMGCLSKHAHQVFVKSPKNASEKSRCVLEAPAKKIIVDQLLGNSSLLTDCDCPNDAGVSLHIQGSSIPPFRQEQHGCFAHGSASKGLDMDSHPISEGGKRSWVDIVGTRDKYEASPYPKKI